MSKESSWFMRRTLRATGAALTASVLALAAPSGAQERPPVAGTADSKPFRLFLSDISVKVRGSDSWINAE